METSVDSNSQNYTGIRGMVHRLKAWTEAQALKKHSLWILFFIAFVESSFFPIPPDVLLIAMCVVAPKKSFKYALVCTVGSVLGGLAGYGLGYLAWWIPGTKDFGPVAHFFFNYIPGFSVEGFDKVRLLYEKWDFWIVFTAGLTPIPYKLFTIAGGVFQISLIPFLLASILGRAARFFMVAALFYVYGRQIKTFLDKYFELLSIAFLVLLIAGFAVLKLVL